MTRSVLFDTETTGLDPLTGDRVIEVAALELDNDLPTGNSFHRLIHPQRDIPEEATRVHGITLDKLRDAPRFEEIVDDLLDFFGDGKLVAHNAPFDFGFLNAEFSRARRSALDRSRMVDTLVLAKARFPGMPNSLDALCDRLEVDNSGRTLHGALLDAELLADVYINLTRGQDGLLMESAGAEPSGAQGSRAPKIDLSQFALPVLTASAQDAAEHEAVLAQLDKASGGQTAWRMLQ